MATPDQYEPGRAEECTLEEALGRVEALVEAAQFSTHASREAWAPATGDERARVALAATADEAISKAAEAARQGRRACAIVGQSELLGALGAVEQAAAARAPLLIHVLTDARGWGGAAVQAALSLGVMILGPWQAQEAVDLSLAARRASEDCELPALLVSDVGQAPRATVFTPEADFVGDFLGSARTSVAPPAKMGATGGATIATARHAERSPFALASALRDLGERTGRPLSPLFRFETADADDILIAIGPAVPAALSLAHARRAEGQRVGVVGLRALRPFFGGELVKAVSRAKAIAVLEPHDVALSPCGRLAADLKAAFADALTWASGFPGVGRIPPVVSATFASRPTDDREMSKAVAAALDELGAGDRARRRLVLGV